MQIKFMLWLALLFLGGAVKAQSKTDEILGIWLTTGKEPAKVQIYKSGNKYYGKIIWLQYPIDNAGKVKTDIKNPDQSKRSNTVIGLVIITNFTFNGEDEWKGGDIYDPESGNTYSSYLLLKDKNTLKVRGYVGLSIFGRTEIWSRVN